MAKSSIIAVFPCGVERVWNIVTNLTDWSWRSDLSRIKVLSDTQFIEYTKDGYQTTFTITKTVPYELWEFDMENDNMSGHWVGVFTAEGETTTIHFMEDVKAKKLLMKPFVKGYLKKQQAQYVKDLGKAV